MAHGRMNEGELEQTMIDFWDHRYDVLVATTIIESGLDLPLVNTLIVERADLLGLAQLHQLRGRVGRSGRRAYAYLFHPEQSLTETAFRRLEAIGEHSDLGGGIQIAQRDLEIRGAGSVLGEVQSGHIAAVGFDMYVELVSEAVAERLGTEKPEPPPPEIRIDLTVDAHLPDDYIGDSQARLEAYRTLATTFSQAEVDDVAEEWRDRYPTVPKDCSMSPASGQKLSGWASTRSSSSAARSASNRLASPGHRKSACKGWSQKRSRISTGIGFSYPCPAPRIRSPSCCPF